MYRVSPATYLVGGMASASVGNTELHCSQYELLKFDSPSSQSCGEYMAQYLQDTGNSGRLLNPDTVGQCLYCSVRETNTVLATMGIYVSDTWRDFELQLVYVAFNILATFALYWLVRMPRKKTRSSG